MKSSTSHKSIQVYQQPSLRVVEADLERSFLQSNTERIDDDGQEHGWD